jgi:hypothetical protein
MIFFVSSKRFKLILISGTKLLDFGIKRLDTKPTREVASIIPIIKYSKELYNPPKSDPIKIPTNVAASIYPLALTSSSLAK